MIRLKSSPSTMLTPQQVAERWNLNIKSVYAAIKSGEIPAVRVGKLFRINLDVLRNIEQGRVVPFGGTDGAT